MIQRVFKTRLGNSTVWLRTGHIYSFRYARFQHDPEPVCIVLYALKGIHPTSGNRWNLLECCNLNYVPRNFRKQFAKIWIPLLEYYKGNIVFTWEMVKKRYPFMEIACRRYLLEGGHITELVEIPPEDIEKVVVSTWMKDYSKQVMFDLIARFKKAPVMKKHGVNPFSGKRFFSGSRIFRRK